MDGHRARGRRDRRRDRVGKQEEQPDLVQHIDHPRWHCRQHVNDHTASSDDYYDDGEAIDHDDGQKHSANGVLQLLRIGTGWRGHHLRDKLLQPQRRPVAPVAGLPPSHIERSLLQNLGSAPRPRREHQVYDHRLCKWNQSHADRNGVG